MVILKPSRWVCFFLSLILDVSLEPLFSLGLHEENRVCHFVREQRACFYMLCCDGFLMEYEQAFLHI